MSKQKRLIYRYTDGSEIIGTFYPEKLEGCPDADRIELAFVMKDKRDFSIKMTFAEAVNTIGILTASLDHFLDESRFNKRFNVPLYAKG